MESLESIKARLEAAIPSASVVLMPNGSSGNPSSLLVDGAHILEVAQFLRDDPQLLLDYASNVTGVDWPDAVRQERVRVKRVIQGVEQEFDAIEERKISGCLEVVYHLYSMRLKHGPVILRMRTDNRTDRVTLPSLTRVYRGVDFQEREVFDLFGVRFEGHPDLRRILMWDEFEDYPMRKDYVEPDDYQYEPTPHGAVLAKARKHYPPEVNHG